MSEPWSYPPAHARPDRTKPARLIYDEASKQLLLEFYDVQNRLYRLPVVLAILPPELQELAGPLGLTDLAPDLRSSRLESGIVDIRDAVTDARDAIKRNTAIPVLSLETRTSSGDTYASPIDTSYGSVITFYLDVTAVSGTSPTLDLFIDIQDPVSGKWVNQDKFPTVTATGTWALALPVRSTRYAVRWVLGGTSPSLTFSVGAVITK